MVALKRRLDRFMEVFCVGIITVMVLLVTWQIIARYILNDPSSISEVLTRYLFVWLVITTATYVFGQKDHMCITFLKDKLPAKIKRIVNVVIELITIVFAVSVMIVGGFFITRMQMVQIDSTLHIATGIIYSIIPICGIITVFYCICNIVDFWKTPQSTENISNKKEKTAKAV